MDDEAARTRTIEPRPEPRRARARVRGVVAVYGPASTVGAVVVQDAAVLGRDPSVDVVVDDAGASRRHCELIRQRGSLSVRDLGSRNGTFVDGARVEGTTTLPLGAVLRVGDTLFVVVADAGAYPSRSSDLGLLVGGPSLDDVRAEIRALGPTTAPILIRGETGTGKELAAASLHAASGRAGEFVPVNCAALPADIIESELFGHARGAFSGAATARTGLFARAHDGTLFLDEIGELPLNAQAKLLRVLQDGVVRAVGDDRGRTRDVRVVAATHQDLARLVEQGRFRRDLHHRVASATITLPPLRSRPEDIPELLAHLSDAAPLPDSDAMQHLMMRRWPGNVRELRNAMHAAQARARSVGEEHVRLEFLGAEVECGGTHGEGQEPERRTIEDALRASRGNVSAAARTLGRRRAGLHEAIRRLGIDASAHRRRP